MIMLLGLFLLAFAITWASSPLAAAVGRQFGWVDQPGGRRRHRGKIPRSGGIALFLGLIIVLLVSRHLPAGWRFPMADVNESIWWHGLLLGSIIAFVAGLLDDSIEFSAGPQFAAQLLCSAVAIAFTLFIERVNNPFGAGQIIFPWPVVWLLTAFWVLGMMNTVNWLDGVDGLVAGVTVVFGLVLTVHLWRRGLYDIALWPAVLAGAAAGFLPFNWHPARLFMGSSGTYLLGYLMAVLGIVAGAKVATILLIMGLPIADVAWQIVRRWRSGQSPLRGDRGHLHYRLQDRGWPAWRIVLLYVGWGAVTGLFAIVLSSRLLKLLLLLLLAALLISLFRFVGYQDSAVGKGAERGGKG